MAKDPEQGATFEAEPQGVTDPTQQIAQDVARQQNAAAGAPWADQEARDKAEADAVEAQTKEAEKAAKAEAKTEEATAKKD